MLAILAHLTQVKLVDLKGRFFKFKDWLMLPGELGTVLKTLMESDWVEIEFEQLVPTTKESCNLNFACYPGSSISWEKSASRRFDQLNSGDGFF